MIVSNFAADVDRFEMDDEETFPRIKYKKEIKVVNY